MMTLALADLVQTEATQRLRTSGPGTLGEQVGTRNILEQCCTKALGQLEPSDPWSSILAGDGGGDAAAGTPRAAASGGLTADCAPEPPSKAKRLRAKTGFDGRNYGEDYLLVAAHDGLEILPNAEASHNWIFVRITSPKPPGLRLEGWVPDWLPEEVEPPQPKPPPPTPPASGKAPPPPAPPLAPAPPGAPRASAQQGQPPPGRGGEAEEDDPWWQQPDPWQGKDHPELVASVRAALEKRGQSTWHDWCQRNKKPVTDPGRCHSTTLNSFLKDLEAHDSRGEEAKATGRDERKQEVEDPWGASRSSGSVDAAEDRRDWSPQDWAEAAHEVHRGTLKTWVPGKFGFINNHGLVGVGDIYVHGDRFVTPPPLRDLKGSVVEFQVIVDGLNQKQAKQIRIIEEGKKPTVLCRYYSRGYCYRGDLCTYVHTRYAQEQDRGGEPAPASEPWPAEAAAAGSSVPVFDIGTPRRGRSRTPQGGAQPDATFNLDEDASALLAWLPESCRYEVNAAARRGDVQQLTLDIGRRPRAKQGNKWVFLSDMPLSAVELRELFARTEGAVESGEIGGIKSSLHRVLPVLAPGGRRATGVTVRPAFARTVFTSAFSDVDIENTGSVLVAGPRGSGKSTWLRHAACRLSGQAEVLVLDPEGELGGLGGECGAPHAALGAARRTALPAGSCSAEAVAALLRRHRPEVLVVDDMDAWFGAAAQDVAKAVMESDVKLVCAITVVKGLAKAILDSAENETLASTTLTGCRDSFSAVIELKHVTHAQPPADADFQ